MNEHSKEAKEFSDKTVEKAIEAACEHFKCKKEELEIEIITRGSTGLFGLGGRKAKITARPTKEDVEESALESEEVTETAPQEKTGVEGERRPKIDNLKQVPQEEFKEEVDEEKTQPIQAQNQIGQTPEKRPPQKRKREEISPEVIEKQVATACEIANEILEKSGLDGKAEAIEQTTKPYINITGKDLSLIIGKDGRTLDALEYLINLCLKKKDKEINYRVAVEAGGYRERRRKSLTSLAEKMAFKARKTGKAVSLQPMPARERRIVHLALRNFKGIKTHSSGEESGRKVVITPLRSKKRPKRNKK